MDFNRLPLEIDYSAARTLEPAQIVSLLSYRGGTNEIRLITPENVLQELEKAGRHETESRIGGLEGFIRERVQAVGNYQDLLDLGKAWGEYNYACFENGVSPDAELAAEIDNATERLILAGGLKNAFYATAGDPKTVDKIPAFLKTAAKRTSKIALVCFDGMGEAEWVLMKTCLASLGFGFSERHLFALIPTVTKISRSAIFYGDCISVYSIKTPDEAGAFGNHFKDATCKFFREGDISEERILGIDLAVIIYNFFDDIAHDVKLPQGDRTKYLYFKSVLAYLDRSRIKDELTLLKKGGLRHMDLFRSRLRGGTRQWPPN